MMTNLALFGNKVLRTAIQQNLVTFPSQVPVFAKHEAGELQARIVQLFFIGGWSIRKIANRYGMAPDKVRKTLTDWRVRAIASGYVQEVGPEVLPALASTTDATADAMADATTEATESEAAEDLGDEGPDAPTEPARTALQVVAVPNATTKPERVNILHLLLEELEAGIERDAVWEPYRRRLLQILKEQCIQSGLALSIVQAERVEAVLEVNPEQAYDLLRDLNQRIRDEERCAEFAGNFLGNKGPGRNGLLHMLLLELETAAREQYSGSTTCTSTWPRHCGRFLMAIKQGCVDLGMEFSLAQVRRVEDALAADPQRLGDLIRDLQNRLADEQEQASLICVGRSLPRRLAMGSRR